MADRPIGFENHYTNNSGGDSFRPSGQQLPYGYPPMNSSPGYGQGYGAAYPPAMVNEPSYPHVQETYPLEMHRQPTVPPAPAMPVVDSANGQQSHIPSTVFVSLLY